MPIILKFTRDGERERERETEWVLLGQIQQYQESGRPWLKGFIAVPLICTARRVTYALDRGCCFLASGTLTHTSSRLPVIHETPNAKFPFVPAMKSPPPLCKLQLISHRRSGSSQKQADLTICSTCLWWWLNNNANSDYQTAICFPNSVLIMHNRVLIEICKKGQKGTGV